MPVGGVAGRIGIEQRIAKPFLAAAPVDQKVLDQEGCGDHANAVVHVTGLPEFAHPGIDDRITGHALGPGAEIGRVELPFEGIELVVPVFCAQIGKLDQQIVAEIAPGEFLAVMDQIVAMFVSQPVGGVPDTGRGYFAERQMRRQSGGRVDRREIATAFVIMKVGVDQVFEPFLRTGLAGRPVSGKNFGPVRFCRQKFPAIERFGTGMALGRRDGFRRVNGAMRLVKLLHGVPERRVDLEGITGAGADQFRIMQQLAVKGADGDACILERDGDLAVDRGSLIGAIDVDRLCAGLAGNIDDDVIGLARRKHQVAAQ
ncbi:hypothetical protein D3C73_818880 [compost metagenome]